MVDELKHHKKKAWEKQQNTMDSNIHRKVSREALQPSLGMGQGRGWFSGWSRCHTQENKAIVTTKLKTPQDAQTECRGGHKCDLNFSRSTLVPSTSFRFTEFLPSSFSLGQSFKEHFWLSPPPCEKLPISTTQVFGQAREVERCHCTWPVFPKRWCRWTKTEIFKMESATHRSFFVYFS